MKTILIDSSYEKLNDHSLTEFGVICIKIIPFSIEVLPEWEAVSLWSTIAHFWN